MPKLKKLDVEGSVKGVIARVFNIDESRITLHPDKKARQEAKEITDGTNGEGETADRGSEGRDTVDDS